MKKLIAFHGDQAVKQKYLARVKAHYDADEIVQGIYWENGKGCAVGCTLEKDNGQDGKQIHQRMEDELGIPRMLACIEDRIFEGLENREAKKFPLRFLKSIKPGTDLSMVVPKFMVWILSDDEHGVRKHATERGQKALDAVVDLYKRKIAGEQVAERHWRDAYAAADAYADAYAAADAYADAYAAASASYAAAAYSAAYAAADAADAAADAYAAASADRSKTSRAHYKVMADKLVELLKEAA